MPEGAKTWATHQLAEFLAAVSACEDETEAVRRAVERAAEALEAEAGAVVRDGTVVTSIGFPRGEAPEAELVRIAASSTEALDVPGVGPCAPARAPLDGAADDCLVLLRECDERFTREEEHLLRAMGKTLSMTTRMLRLLDEERNLRERSEEQSRENERLLVSLRERQGLLERLAAIQRSIVHRTDLQELLDAVVRGARDLLGDEVVGLRLVDESCSTRTTLVAEVGIDTAVREQLIHGTTSEGAGGLAIERETLVVIDRYESDPAALPALAGAGLQAAMAAPVHQNGRVCGSLTIASKTPGRVYSDSEREVLLAFAEHASLALTDARNFAEAMRQAYHDSLTGLPNRELFADRLEQNLRKAERGGTDTGVLFLDLDGFKNVNDSLGHAAGDELLVGIARRITAVLRDEDTAARFGGDEFAVLLANLDEISSAAAVAERLLGAIRKPLEVAGQTVAVTASVGIATGATLEEDLIRNADLAMYRAKARGRDRFEVFEPSLHAAAVQRLTLEADLKRALERDELCLHYQPIVALRSGRIAGVEALVRWNHPERGLLAPDAFIPLAEETRQVVPIGRWVLNEACRQAAAWQAIRPSLAIGVNLSAVQLDQPLLVDEVAQTLAETGLDPRSLMLEITETVLMQDVESTTERLGNLKDLGVQLAVDDFGTGYSSLQYLRGFPIDILKIAKSFVDGVSGASDDSALARAIIDLGDSFQLRVVAEGIEHRVQLDRLLELGCDLGQGFYFAKPMPAALLEDLLGSSQTLPGDPVPLAPL